MEIVKQKFEEEKVDDNSTTFVRSDNYQITTVQQQATPLLETLKWPLIGIGASIVSIVLLTCATTVIRKKSSNELSVKIENTPSNNTPIQINNSLHQSGVMGPSGPPFNPSFVEEVEQQKPVQVPTLEEKIAAVPTLEEKIAAVPTLEEKIAATMAIKPEHRNALHHKNLCQYQLELKESSKQQTEL